MAFKDNNNLRGIKYYAGISIAFVDKSTLSITKILPLPKFQAESIKKKAYPYTHGVFLSGDTIHVVTSIWDKSQKNYAVHVWPINLNSLEPYTPNPKLLARIPDNGKYIYTTIQLKHFEKSRERVLLYTETNKKTKSKILNVLHLNNEFALLKKTASLLKKINIGKA